MKKKYWKSLKNRSVTNERLVQLESLFAFVNLDLTTNGNKGIPKTASEYFDRLTLGLVNSDIRSLIFKHDDIDFFRKVQSHLAHRIEANIYASENLWDMPLLNVEVSVHGRENRFTVILKLDDTGPEELLEKGKRLIDFCFFTLLRDLDLKPKRFRKCQKCKNYFYQPTVRQKNYCSVKCANAIRQARFQKKKK